MVLSFSMGLLLPSVVRTCPSSGMATRCQHEQMHDRAEYLARYIRCPGGSKQTQLGRAGVLLNALGALVQHIARQVPKSSLQEANEPSYH